MRHWSNSLLGSSITNKSEGSEVPMVKSAHERGRPPQAVKQITIFLIVGAVVFGCPGVLVILDALLQPNEPSAPPLCGGFSFLVLGAALGTLAIEFYRLHRWTYPFVRILVTSWWGLRGAHMLGLDRKIKSPEVRRAFGLPPISEGVPEKR